MKFIEKHPRSIAKVISWRVLLTASHTINGLIVTGSLMVGLKIAGLALIINSVLYWIHERVWNFLQWNRKENDKLNFSEGNPRSLSKMISWRILITVSNFVIPFVLTGSWGQAALFTGLATAVNMGLYWGHERAWNWVRWGKESQADTKISEDLKII
jgi:uncharacterized membrane protein